MYVRLRESRESCETLGCGCNDHTNGVPRLDVPQYMWLVETNTGVNSACYGQGKCATTFPGPMGMAASFNRSAWRLKGETLGAELRAFNNLRWHRDAGGTTSEKIGLTGFGPNINIARDPRFGRSSELPGEDPVLSGIYASERLSVTVTSHCQRECQNILPAWQTARQ